MTTGRRLWDFVSVWLMAAAVWVGAQWLWPYLELVAPVGALVAFLIAVNVVDATWFAIRHRSRFALGRTTRPRQRAADRRTVAVDA